MINIFRVGIPLPFFSKIEKLRKIENRKMDK